MTLVGKILTFLILIMSMVFMTFTMATYATHRNWREMVDGTPGKPGLKGQLDIAKSLVQEKEEENEALRLKLERERVSRAESLASKETHLTLVKSELNSLQTKFTTLEAEHRKSIEALAVAQTQMEKATSELATVRSDYQHVVRDKTDARAAATAAADQALKVNGELAVSEQRRNRLTTQLAETTLMLDQQTTGVATRGGVRIAGRAPIEREGQVTAVGKKDLVVVSIGSDEGLVTGDTLEVWRGNGSYIGRLVIVETRTDTSTARVVPEYLQGTIRQGDSVGTKLL